MYVIMSNMFTPGYFGRWSDFFPMRKVNFTCTDPDISFSEDDPSFSSFSFNAVIPTEVVYSLSLCVPPFVVSTVKLAYYELCYKEHLDKTN